MSAVDRCREYTVKLYLLKLRLDFYESKFSASEQTRIEPDIDEDAGFDQIVSDRELVSGGNRRTSLKRKQGMEVEVEGVGGNGDVTSSEQVPSSPPTRPLPGIDCSAPSAKRAKHIFKRCFEATFDPSSIPGTEKVLAPDSDEDEGETRSFDAIYARKRNNKR